MPAHENDFDWNNDEDVIIRAQRATAVHFNKFGHVVIRQERDWPDEDVDPCLVFSPENVPKLIEALARLITISSPPMRLVDGIEPAASRDLTAAERQRRWRKRHSNGARNGDRNGDRNGATVTQELPLLDNHKTGD